MAPLGSIRPRGRRSQYGWPPDTRRRWPGAIDGSHHVELDGWLRHWAGRMTLGLGNLLAVFRHLNLPGRSRRNVAHHYDLTDELFDCFVDPWRQYSCAYFHNAEDSLETAQITKLLPALPPNSTCRTGTAFLISAAVGAGWRERLRHAAGISAFAGSHCPNVSLPMQDWPRTRPTKRIHLISSFLITVTRRAALTVSCRSACWNMSGHETMSPI